MNGAHNFLVAAALLALAASIASAYDPSPLQDFCVATNDIQNGLFVNGKFCKNPKLVNSRDFFGTGYNIPQNTNNRLGFAEIFADVNTIPGLNTQGLALSRQDYGPLGLNPPHTHPRASEVLAVSEGTLYVGFVSSFEDGNRLFTKVLTRGNLFLFPFGLAHFQFNPSRTRPAVAFSAFSSQNPGTITLAKSVFGSSPPINSTVLSKAFQLDSRTVQQLQQKFANNN